VLFRDVINLRQLLQKSNRANHLQCSHRFSVPYMGRPMLVIFYYVNFMFLDVIVTLLAFMLEF